VIDRQSATELYEDPLLYLPRKRVREFAKNSVIYDDAQNPCAGLYVVILGRVKICTTAEDGGETIGRLVRTEGLFGEASLIRTLVRNESAFALEPVVVMSWSRDEIEQEVEREPRLGLALSQYLVRECLELQDRIENMAIHKTPERVMLALLQLAADLGSPTPDGSLRVASLPHHTIAEFVGTSREVVTCQMNRMRRLGLVGYSRKHIDVNTEAIRETLYRQGISTRDGGEAAGRTRRLLGRAIAEPPSRQRSQTEPINQLRSMSRSS
jgi:CRP-like cAMP-binding protein